MGKKKTKKAIKRGGRSRPADGNESTDIPKRGGRPRINDGTELSVTFNLDRQAYARMNGFISIQKEDASKTGDKLSAISKRVLMKELIDKHWKSLPLKMRRRIERSELYQESLANGNVRV